MPVSEEDLKKLEELAQWERDQGDKKAAAGHQAIANWVRGNQDGKKR